MIEKEALSRILKEALDAEEKGVLIYAKHLESAIFWTGIKKDKVQKARELLRELAQGSLGHKKIVAELIEEVRKTDKHAF